MSIVTAPQRVRKGFLREGGMDLRALATRLRRVVGPIGASAHRRKSVTTLGGGVLARLASSRTSSGVGAAATRRARRARRVAPP